MTVKSVHETFENGSTRSGWHIQDVLVLRQGTRPDRIDLFIFSNEIILREIPDPLHDNDGDPIIEYHLRTEDIPNGDIKINTYSGSSLRFTPFIKVESFFILTRSTLDKVYDETGWHDLANLPPVLRRRGQKHLANLINDKLSKVTHNNWFLNKPVTEDGATFIVVQSQGMWATIHGVIGTDRAGLDLEDLYLPHLVQIARELSFTLEEVMKDFPLPPV